MIETERLILRPWLPADREPFAALNADERVGEWLGGTLDRERSDLLIDRANAHVAEHGYGLSAAERRADGAFLGMIGLRLVPLEWNHPMSGEVEIGWRLAPDAWGAGYATEGAAAALAWGLAHAVAPRIVSYTASTNVRSEAVMRRIGMTRDESLDFDHPDLAPGHPLRRHIVYVRSAAPIARS